MKIYGKICNEYNCESVNLGSVVCKYKFVNIIYIAYK